MKESFSFVKRPKVVFWVSCAVLVISIAAAVWLYFKYNGSSLFFAPIYLTSFGLNFAILSFGWTEIDLDNKTLTVSKDRKHPIDIQKVDKLICHVMKHGKIKSFTIHEAGIRYLDFNVADKERLIEVLKGINPDIVITKMNA